MTRALSWPGARVSWVSPVHCVGTVTSGQQWVVSARLCFTPETETEQSLPALRPGHCATRDSWQSVTKWPSAWCRWHYVTMGRAIITICTGNINENSPGKLRRELETKRGFPKKTAQININVVCDWQGQESRQIVNPIIKLIDDMIIFDHQLTFHDFIDWNRNGFTKTHIHIQLTDCWAMFMANSIWAFTWQSNRLRTVFIPVNVG